jgi:hypothetical protein
LGAKDRASTPMVLGHGDDRVFGKLECLSDAELSTTGEFVSDYAGAEAIVELAGKGLVLS